MHASVRPYATTGVALVAASVISVTPIAPPLTDVEIHNPAVQLTQLANPFQAYVQVFQEASLNLQAILSAAADNPTPILSRILSNQFVTLQALLASGGAFTIPSLSQILTALTSQSGALQSLLAAIQTAVGEVVTALTTTVPAFLQAAFSDLTSLNVEGAINNVLLAGLAALFPLTGLIPPALAVIAQPLQNLVNAINLFGPIGEILANPLQNVVNVLNALGAPFLPGISNGALFLTGLIGPLIEGPAAFGVAVQGVIDAIGAGNPAGVLGAIIDGPAVILGGLLNGAVGPDLTPITGINLGIPTLAGGLLTPFTFNLTIPAVTLPGTIPALQELQELIVGALHPPTIPAAMAAPLQLANAATSNAPSALPNLTATTVTLPASQTTKTGLADPTGGKKMASGSPAASGTGMTTTTAADLTAGNKVRPGKGTKAGGALAKTLGGLAGGFSHAPKRGAHS